MRGDPASLFAKAVQEFEASRFADAAATLLGLRALLPNHPDILHLAGVVATRIGRNEEAVALLEKAERGKPRVASIPGELSAVFLRLHLHDQAISAAKRALAIDRNLFQAKVTLGRALTELGRLREAVAALEEAVDLQPNDANLLNDLGHALNIAGKDDEAALNAYERAVAIDPRHAKALDGLLFARMKRLDWRDFDAIVAQLADSTYRGEAALDPFRALLVSDSPELHLRAAQKAAALFEQPPRYPARPRASASRIRIGYVSGTIGQHPTSYAIAEMIELHDRDLFEVFGYSIRPSDRSALGDRVSRGFDVFRDLHNLTDREIADGIHADGIDILVDLQGHTSGTRLPIVAARPAPVQVNWLGFPGSSGASFHDFIIGDEVVIPRGLEDQFTEAVVRLPYSYHPMDRTRLAAATPTRRELGLPDEAFVFCSFNAATKLTPQMFSLWAQALAEVPESVLWILVNDVGLTSLRREAEARGIAPHRIIPASKMTPTEHLARLRVADLMLDSFPYNAHTTAMEALWMGLPIVTYAGRSFASRVAASLLTAAGLPNLIAHSPDHFVEKAIHLATDRAVLRSVRRQLNENRDTLPLFDTSRFTRDLEAAYRAMLSAQR